MSNRDKVCRFTRYFFTLFRRFCYWFSPTYTHMTCNTLLCHTFIFLFFFRFFPFFWLNNCICRRLTMSGKKMKSKMQWKQKMKKKKPRERLFFFLFGIASLCDITLLGFVYACGHINTVKYTPPLVWLHWQKIEKSHAVW